jgi:hypothetical protein
VFKVFIEIAAMMNRGGLEEPEVATVRCWTRDINSSIFHATNDKGVAVKVNDNTGDCAPLSFVTSIKCTLLGAFHTTTNMDEQV